jgi:PsbP-like protein
MTLAKLVLLMSTLALLSGCASTRSSPPLDDEKAVTSSAFDLTKTFHSTGHGFSVNYPGTWESYETGDVNYIMFGGPRIDSALFMNDGSFAIKIFKLPDGITSRGAYDENMKSFRADTNFKDFRVISEEEVLLDGRNAIRVLFTATVGVQTTSLQYYLVASKKLYILGGSVPSSELGKYDDLYSDIANTFNLD